MEPLTQSARTTLGLNSALFVKSVEGIDDAAARRPLGSSARRVDHIAAHLLDARGSLGTMIGAAVRHDLLDLLAAAPSFDALGDRAPLSLVRAAWESLAPELARSIEALESTKLAEPAPREFPVRDPSLLGAITFLLQHEAYHIGQLGLLRRELGLPALQYPAAEDQ
jgi:uncharacterized damage-inducible protein DinB